MCSTNALFDIQLGVMEALSLMASTAICDHDKPRLADETVEVLHYMVARTESMLDTRRASNGKHFEKAKGILVGVCDCAKKHVGVMVVNKLLQ